MILDPKFENYYFCDILNSISLNFKEFNEIRNTKIFANNKEELFKFVKDKELKNVKIFLFSEDIIDIFDFKDFKIFGDSSIVFIHGNEIINKYNEYNRESVIYSSFLQAENLNEYIEENFNSFELFLPKILNNKSEILFNKNI